eukprot:m.203714 g.203714  ORF g.203714 m.203714 type:complete len:389 (-) comp18857_c0_seq6:172-1338(-)
MNFWRITALLQLASTVLLARGYPTLWDPPLWSLQTLGHATFAHVTKTTPFNATDLELLKKYQIVQFDKGQDVLDMPFATQEDRFIRAAKQVKAVNPNAKLLMYINGLINFPNFERIYNATKADPSLLLKNTKGEFITTGPIKNGTFDMRNSAMRKLFVADALYGIHSGVFDGVFIDRANFAARVLVEPELYARDGWDLDTAKTMVPAQTQLFNDLTTALGEEYIVLAKETGGGAAFNDWKVANAAMTTDTFCSQYKTTKAPKFNKTQCAEDIATVQTMAARGQLTESHGQGDLSNETQREFTMACFLIAAGNMSYFSYASWEKGLAWNLAGTRWWAEYDYPLGTPLGPAQRAGAWQYYRNFSSGTTVQLDLQQQTAHIAWAHRTRPQA